MMLPVIANVRDAETLEQMIQSRAETNCRIEGDLFHLAIHKLRIRLAESDSICRYCVGTDNMHYLSCPVRGF